VPHPVLTDMKPRLEAAAADLADARERYKTSLELRNELVLAAVDHGMSQRHVAAAAHVAVSRVSALLLAGSPDEDHIPA
jgi:predicted XRE-type DNA-binding protein